MSVRYGILGSGHMGRTYASVLSPDDGGSARLVAIAGGTRAEGLAQASGVDHEPSAERLLERDDIDAVIVATPHSTHLPLTLAAAGSGKHVLMEKPMAVTTADCQAMIDACEAAGVLLSVGKISRRLHASEVARELIESGAIGPVQMMEAWRLRAGYELELVGPKRWIDDPAEGGAFLDWGTHGCDILRWMAGTDPTIAFGQFGTFGPDRPAQASGMAQYVFPGGVMAQVWMSYEVAASMGARTRYTFAGPDGVLELHPFGRVSVGHGRDWEVVYERDGFGGPDEPADETQAYFRDGFAGQVADFTAAVAGDAPLRVSGRDGLVAVEMVEAAERSSATGRAVPLPLSPSDDGRPVA